MICFIPSKNRPKTKTYQLFKEAQIPFLHFIEPQEMHIYNVPNKISVDKNDAGIAYVRNFMLKYAKDNGHDWVIMCDDDVDHFGKYEEGNKKISSFFWYDLLEKAKKLPFELYGINYRKLAWTSKTEYSINKTFVEVCVLLNIKKIKWNYRPEFNLKEDRDFVLQSIKYGNGIIRFNKFFYNCPDVGKNIGGLQKSYKLKKDEESAKKMCYEWHPFATLHKKGERIDVKVDVKSLALHFKKVIK